MPAPKGNKNASGKSKGAPPKHFSDEQVIEMGKDLIKWLIKNETNDSIVHLSQWYVKEKDMDRDQFDALRHRVEFLHYYKKALDLMGNKILLNKELPTAYGSRYVASYHRDLRLHEKEIAFEKIDHEAEVKAKADIGKQVAPNDDKLERLITSLDSLKKDKE